MRRFRIIAWLSLLATLYSAASPTLAAIFLANTPAALGQMLGIPAASADATAAEDCASHSEHDAPAPTHDASSSGTPQPAHTSHGIYCSLCLNPSSIATIAVAPVSVWVLGLAFDVPRPKPTARLFSSFLPLYRSRAPPAAS